MINQEEIINGLEHCLAGERYEDYPCKECSYGPPALDCVKRLYVDAIKLIKEQQQIIDTYHKADAFLAAHGWEWNNELN